MKPPAATPPAPVAAISEVSGPKGPEGPDLAAVASPPIPPPPVTAAMAAFRRFLYHLRKMRAATRMRDSPARPPITPPTTGAVGTFEALWAVVFTAVGPDPPAEIVLDGAPIPVPDCVLLLRVELCNVTPDAVVGVEAVSATEDEVGGELEVVNVVELSSELELSVNDDEIGKAREEVEVRPDDVEDVGTDVVVLDEALDAPEDGVDVTEDEGDELEEAKFDEELIGTSVGSVDEPEEDGDNEPLVLVGREAVPEKVMLVVVPVIVPVAVSMVLEDCVVLVLLDAMGIEVDRLADVFD